MAGSERALAIFAVALHLCLTVASSSSLGNTDPRYGRTAYHFQPATNWMNDPNGPLFHKGLYHLFYQYNPHGPLWDIGNLSWGHSVSRDLVNWDALPTAIYPTSPFDNHGCWSGSATVIPGGVPAILYTGINASKVQVQNIAFPKNPSDPLLREWDKPGFNPVMPLPADVPADKFRDPSTAWLGKDGLWRVAVSGEVDGVGSTLVYKSKDFLHWERNAAPLHASSAAGMVECSDLFPVAEHGTDGLDTLVTGPGVKHVLKLSVMDTLEDYYMVGTYDEATDAFVPGEPARGVDYRNWRRFDYGHVYASKSFFDAGKNRRVLWTWANESDSREDDVARGWSGIQAFPRKVWLDKDGKQLMQWPVEEIETLRQNRVGLQAGPTILKTGALEEITGVAALQADVEAVFEIPSLQGAEPFDPSWEMDAQKLCGEKNAFVRDGVGPFGLIVMASGDMKEHTAIFFRVFKYNDKYKVLMCTDLSRSSTRAGVYKPPFGGFVEMDIQEHKTITLRTLIDHSVIKSFADGGRTCITARVYPEHVSTSNSHTYVFNNGNGVVKVSKLEAWNLATAAVNV